jgi:hypothetical protein
VAEASRQVRRAAPGIVVQVSETDREEPAMTWILLNIPLMVLFFALWVGIPLWLVRKHPDTKPALAAAPGVTRLPARQQQDADYRRVA